MESALSLLKIKERKFSNAYRYSKNMCKASYLAANQCLLRVKLKILNYYTNKFANHNCFVCSKISIL